MIERENFCITLSYWEKSEILHVKLQTLLISMVFVSCHGTVKKSITKDNRCGFIKLLSQHLFSDRQSSLIWNWLWWSLKWHCCLQHCTRASRNRATQPSQKVSGSIYLPPLPSGLWTLKVLFPREAQHTNGLLYLCFASVCSHQSTLIFDVTFTENKKILTRRCYEHLRRPQI